MLTERHDKIIYIDLSCCMKLTDEFYSSATEADALLFGHLQAILRSSQKNGLLVQSLENFPELVRYCVTVGKLCGFNAG